MGRIIIVEDNLTFSGYVCGLLQSKGFQTVSTSTCNGARKLFAKMSEDDIVLADLRLNDGDGITLLEELRIQGKRNPYIIMTDYDEVPTAVRSMKSGAEDYIPKKLLEMSLLEKPRDFDPFGQTGFGPFGYNMIAPLKSWCWGAILFYPFKISRFS